MKVEPCPFCGNKKPTTLSFGTYVWCSECDARGPAGSGNYKDNIEKWNQRTSTSTEPHSNESSTETQ